MLVNLFLVSFLLCPALLLHLCTNFSGRFEKSCAHPNSMVEMIWVIYVCVYLYNKISKIEAANNHIPSQCFIHVRNEWKSVNHAFVFFCLVKLNFWTRRCAEFLSHSSLFCVSYSFSLCTSTDLSMFKNPPKMKCFCWRLFCFFSLVVVVVGLDAHRQKQSQKQKFFDNIFNFTVERWGCFWLGGSETVCKMLLMLVMTSMTKTQRRRRNALVKN